MLVYENGTTKGSSLAAKKTILTCLTFTPILESLRFILALYYLTVWFKFDTGCDFVITELVGDYPSPNVF